ncbi:hypothetical protein HY949_03670 [Candidatus Gottesmanbacteria bacterium]|nr:hypothetical protein [Candidatus Gottesmanbacteria bacterium]
MNTHPEAVTEVPANGAALVSYEAYKIQHPTIPSDREIAAARPDARVLELSNEEAVLVHYSEFDVIRLRS